MADPAISGNDVFSHACLGATDLAASTRFYEAALAPLGDAAGNKVCAYTFL
jgi:hypothetical protein